MEHLIAQDFILYIIGTLLSHLVNHMGNYRLTWTNESRETGQCRPPQIKYILVSCKKNACKLIVMLIAEVQQDKGKKNRHEIIQTENEKQVFIRQTNF